MSIQIIHWVMAAMIAYLILTSHFEDMESVERAERIKVHAALGAGLFCLGAVRLWLVRKLPVPDKIAGPLWQERLAAGVKRAFYVLFFLVPVLGLILAGLVAYDVDLAGAIRVSGWLRDDPSAAALMNSVHGFSVDILTGLIVLHMVGTLYHQFVRRDGLVARMLPSWPSRARAGSSPS
ncbi:hypothetical protein HK107_14635 [Parvularcula sp. ZS-1/3]|uniref:Cytochrome b561 bacterial/Ni-hydrogenase domain-containing protein n=1 Tax=Parvularcula mediterranea TaxID=2732508 RepID=A0A7Y3RPR4_9PROT|nr:hypothetical protein [Parvularcula mediterranea]